MARQERECRKLAESRGWELVNVYVDNDLTAYAGKPRPQYKTMLDAVRAGEIDALVAVEPERFWRHVREAEDFLDLIQAHKIEVATVRGGKYDPGTADGRRDARQAAVYARWESERKSERVRSAHEEIAAEGRFHGGRRPYGFRLIPPGEDGVKGRLEIDPAEQAVIREAAARVLGGETLYGVCALLNERGVPTVKGGAWRTPTLKRILTSETTAGKREHKGEIVGDASWPALLDETTWRQLRRLLLNGKKRGRVAKVALLSGGLARCGRCGAPLYSARKEKARGAKRIYVCMRPPYGNGCGRLTVDAGHLETDVVELALRALDTPAIARELAGVNRPEPEAGEDPAALERELVELAEDFGEGRIGRAEWIAARQAVERRLEAALEAERAAVRPAVEEWTGPGIRELWPDLSLDEKRAALAALFEEVRVHPARRPGPTWDAVRVEITALGGRQFIGGVPVAVTEETPPLPAELPGTPESRERARRALAGED